jgi:hypothetical protein
MLHSSAIQRSYYREALNFSMNDIASFGACPVEFESSRDCRLIYW